MKWKYTIVASAVTSFLFMIGKNLIGLYLSKSNTITIYGAAGSLIVILLWVYYISAILYFGAHIIKAYANYEGNMLNKKN
jgi:membrane protein